jgi:hypothetical protein
MKRSTSPPPPAHSAQPSGERGGLGKGGANLWSPKDFLNKNMSYTSIIIKSPLKITILLKTSETNIFLKIICKAFLFFKQIFSLRHPIFSKIKVDL